MCREGGISSALSGLLRLFAKKCKHFFGFTRYAEPSVRIAEALPEGLDPSKN